MNLQQIANQFPNAFTYASKVTKSYIPANKMAVDESSIVCLKPDKPVGSIDSIHQKKKSQEPIITNDQAISENTPSKQKILDETSVVTVKLPLKEANIPKVGQP